MHVIIATFVPVNAPMTQPTLTMEKVIMTYIDRCIWNDLLDLTENDGMARMGRRPLVTRIATPAVTRLYRTLAGSDFHGAKLRHASLER